MEKNIFVCFDDCWDLPRKHHTQEGRLITKSILLDLEVAPERWMPHINPFLVLEIWKLKTHVRIGIHNVIIKDSRVLWHHYWLWHPYFKACWIIFCRAVCKWGGGRVQTNFSTYSCPLRPLLFHNFTHFAWVPPLKSQFHPLLFPRSRYFKSCGQPWFW